MKSLLPLLVLLALAACESPSPPSGVKIGKPYVIGGKAYYPEYDPTYDKIGEASWYGPGFHGKRTANGERYNQNDLTAAHPTLPMPSLVRVTNLASGRSLIVRINDRGPFAANRIIDLSRRSASDLGIHSTAQVRVQFLKEETETYLASLQDGGRPDMIAFNAQEAARRDASVLRSTEPGEQIVEATVANTHAGQTVSAAAPIVSVDRDDLQGSAAPAPSSPNAVIASAWAETLPPPPVVEPQRAVPPPMLAPSAPKEKTSAQASSPFYIQAGSFAAEDNAHRAAAKLADVAAVDVHKVEMREKSWWRVRLGGFSSREAAARALNRVRAAGLPDARIVHR